MRAISKARLAAVVAAAVVSAPVAQAAPGFSLPEPMGPHGIGTTSTRLVNLSGPDPLREPEQPFRELMVSAFYPARDVDRYPEAPYMLPGAAKAFDEMGGSGAPAGKIDWAATRTHAHLGAPVDRRGGPRPVVLYSAGAGDPRTWNASEVEDLVSRGFVVVTIDHTYDAAGVEFPGGRVERSVLPGRIPPGGPPPTELLRTVIDTRVADTRFVLDELGSLPGIAGAVDLRRIGMLGHSGGGFTALQSMHDDPRIRAAIDMDGLLSHTPDDDGTNLSTVATDGLDRPFLLFGHEPGGHRTRPSWGALWANSTGWKRDLVLTGAEHASFTDAEVLLPQAGIPVGTIDPARAIAAKRAYVAAFFDRFLRGGDGRSLDRPSTDHPEVEFLG